MTARAEHTARLTAERAAVKREEDKTAVRRLALWAVGDLRRHEVGQ